MKMRYLVDFDPELIAPKEIRAKLIEAGVPEGDIKLARRLDTPPAGEGKKKKSDTKGAAAAAKS